ncbi:MAG TPA: hypothetical protein VMM18_02215 [Gemmatimonadaceae bacterium]|nr:hypothetical protein [Gemmatimonadaceae bacterium]
MYEGHSVVREGAIAGAIGASAVAVWFLVVDIIAGEPLYTPALLGRALFSLFGPVPAGETAALHIVGYTIFHFAAFVAVGMLVVRMVHWAHSEPSVLAGFLMLFVAFQLGFYGFVTLLAQQDVLGALAWWQIGAANLIAALFMGIYIWRTHPALWTELSHTLEGGERRGE